LAAQRRGHSQEEPPCGHDADRHGGESALGKLEIAAETIEIIWRQRY